jgi:tetratricopeptide (TPR) repeat protein
MYHQIGDRTRALRDITTMLIREGQIDAALAGAFSILEIDNRIEALGETVGAMMTIGQDEKAFTIIGSFKSVHERNHVLAKVISHHIAKENVDYALMLVGMIEDPCWHCEEAIGSVAVALVKKNRFDEALALAQKAASTYRQRDILSELAVTAATFGKIRQVLKIADLLEHEWDRNRFWRAVVPHLAKAGRIKDALRLAQNIRERTDQTYTLREIVEILILAKHFDKALLATSMIRDDYWQNLTIRSVAVAMVDAGHIDAALAIVSSMGHGNQDEALREIVKTLIAAERLDEALEVADSVMSPSYQAMTFCSVAEALTASDAHRASTILRKAFASTLLIDELWKQAGMLHEIALIAAKDPFEKTSKEKSKPGDNWRHELLLNIARQLLKMARTVSNRRSKNPHIQSDYNDTYHIKESQSKVAIVLAEMNLVQEALMMANNIGSPSDRIGILDSIAGIQRKAVKTEVDSGNFDVSIRMARSIEKTAYKAESLREIANVLALKGDVRAASVFKEAMIVGRSIVDEKQWAEALIAISTSLSMAGKTNEALSVVNTIINNQDQMAAIHQSTVALVEIDRFSDAITMSSELKDPSQHINTLGIVISMLVNTNRLNEAMEMIYSIQNEQQKSEALFSVVRGLVQAGKMDEAREITESISSEYMQARAFREIAISLANSGRYDEAETLAHVIKEHRIRLDVLVEVSIVMINVGHFDSALKIIQMLEDREHQIDALVVMIEVSVKNKSDYAEMSIDKALKIAHEINENEGKARALRKIAERLVLVKDVRALQILNEALFIARTISGWDRSSVLQQIATTLILANDSRAHGIVDEAMRSYPGKKHEFERYRALSEAALLLARARRFNEALLAAKLIEGEQQRAEALRGIMAELVREGDLDRVLEVAYMIDNVQQRATALREVVEAFIEVGYIDKAVAIAYIIDLVDQRMDTVSIIAAAMTKSNKIGQALALIVPRPIEKFIRDLAEWSPAFEKIEPGLSVAILREVIRISSWVHPRWQQIYAFLENKSEVHSK